MSAAQPGWSNMGFAKTFVLPGCLIFLVPVLGLAFFLHAQARFNAGARESVLQQIRGDAQMSPEKRQEALAFFENNRFSDLMKKPDFAKQFDGTVRFNYFTFRWMIRLSALSILASVAVFLLAGLCVLASLRSQRSQYLSLSIGWQVLRIQGAFQVVVQGLVLVALSYWVTALWMQVYVPKLIFAVAAIALVGVGAVLAAIFKRIDMTHDVEGTLLDPATAGRFFDELSQICGNVGTAPPDQVIVGIDDNFFVTESPVRADGRTLGGRTLFASLSLLKQLPTAEAEGILAHEMAHFSGDDTLYSKKISPLLERYQRYLQALYAGVGHPVFYYMNCFRALFELSLGRRSREREFRADRIAAETTSPISMAAALLRITAFAKFRNEVQQELFKHERVLESANIAEQIAAGFQPFMQRFAAEHDIGELKSSHPFDSHPPLVDRLGALGIPLSPETAESLLFSEDDAPALSQMERGASGWYRMIDGAEEMERRQWDDFEAKFRSIHESSLAYRFLPETDEQREIVVKAFPPISVEGKAGTLSFDHQSLRFTDWPNAIEYREITQCSVNEGTLSIQYQRDGNQKQKLKLKKFGKRAQEAVDALNRYWGRYQSAAAYQAQKRAEEAAAAGSPAESAEPQGAS